ncbi:MAG: hypothetical protein U0350_50000 [Caldilineaceae bacterium]
MLRKNHLGRLFVLIALLLSACQPVTEQPRIFWPQTTPSEHLTLVGHIGGPALSLAVADHYAYVGFSDEFAIFDLTNPLQPTRIGYTPIAATDILVDGHYAYVSGQHGLWIVSLIDPTQPTPVSYLPIAYTTGLAQRGHYLYLADNQGNLCVIDVAQPLYPRQRACLAWPAPITTKVVIAGDYAYLAALDGLYSVDIRDAVHPIIAGYLALTEEPQAVAVVSHTAYVETDAGLTIVDVADAEHPMFVASRAPLGCIMKFLATDRYAYLAAGSAGLRVLDLSKPSQPVVASTLAIAGFMTDVALSGHYAYLTDGNGGLHVVDISQGDQPHYLAKVDLPGVVRNVTLNGRTAYALSSPFWGQTFGVSRLNVTDPHLPVAISAYHALGEIWHLAFAAGDLYLPTEAVGFAQLNATEPLTLTPSPPLPISHTLHDVTVADHYAYVTDLSGELCVVDLQSAGIPKMVGEYRLADPAGMSDVAVAHGFAYLAVGANGLQIVDVRDPSHPHQVSTLDTPGYVQGVDVINNFVYLADSEGGLRIIDVARPTNPRAIAALTLNSPVVDVTVQDHYAFVAAGEGGVYGIDIADPTYLTVVGAFDTPGFANAVAVNGDVVYVADQFGGLWVLRFQP